MWDERRTTVSAAAILADNDTFGAKRKERLDSVSAAVILESFLTGAPITPARNRRSWSAPSNKKGELLCRIQLNPAFLPM